MQKKQVLKFECWDHDEDNGDDLIGLVEVTMSEIMTNPRGYRYELDCPEHENEKRGMIKFFTENVSSKNHDIVIDIKSVKLKTLEGWFFSTPDAPYYQIERAKNIPEELIIDDKKEDAWDHDKDYNLTDFDKWGPIAVYTSKVDPEFIYSKSEFPVRPKFQKIKRKLQQICNSNRNEVIRISFKKLEAGTEEGDHEHKV